MPHDEKPGPDDWRLGIDPADRAETALAPPPAPAAQSAGPRSAQRLERALFVVTAEHLGWLLIAAFTIVTRFAALGARPMFPGEAARALGESALAIGGSYPAAAASGLGWIGLAQVGIFHLLGVSDFSARIIAALGAILLIGAAFALRDALGRAGALGLAGLCAISPTLMYFSRSGTTASAAIGLVMAAVALAIALARRPSVARAAGLAIALVLAIGAGPVGAIGVLTAAAALAIVGVINALARGNTVLRIRVWWTRRGWLLVAGALAFLAVWIFLVEILSAAPLGLPLAASLAPLFNAGARSALSVPRFYLAIIGFYEFAILLAALVGAAAIVAWRVKSYFAGWSLVWMILSLAAWTIARPYRPEFALGFVVPMAIVGAVGFDWLHQLQAWEIIRYPAAALALVTIYVMLLTNVIVAAPNASEAKWERHASLLWSTPATSKETRAECAGAIKSAGHGATAALPDGAPALAWYLRALAPAADPADATVIAKRIASAASGETQASHQFGFEERWKPDFGKLNAAAAMRFFLTAHAWSEVEIEDLAIEVRAPTPSVAPSPTVVVTPTTSPAPTVAPTAAPTAAPALAPLPTPSPTASSSATPAPTPSPSSV
jgi:predicted membrane-bound mannosyltransferase